VSSRLQLPGPQPGAHRRPWELRRVDIDPLGHVNNAAQWAIVEESMPADGSRRGLAEVEHRAPVDPPSGAPLDLVTDTTRAGVCSSWLAAGNAVLTAARWTPAP
jgi:acyl-ACP thioesterase